MDKVIRFDHSLISLDEIGYFTSVKLADNTVRIECYATGGKGVITYENWATEEKAIARIDFLEGKISYILAEDKTKKKTHIFFGNNLITVASIKYFEQTKIVDNHCIFCWSNDKEDSTSLAREQFETQDAANYRLQYLEEILNA